MMQKYIHAKEKIINSKKLIYSNSCSDTKNTNSQSIYNVLNENNNFCIKNYCSSTLLYSFVNFQDRISKNNSVKADFSFLEKFIFNSCKLYTFLFAQIFQHALSFSCVSFFLYFYHLDTIMLHSSSSQQPPAATMSTPISNEKLKQLQSTENQTANDQTNSKNKRHRKNKDKKFSKEKQDENLNELIEFVQSGKVTTDALKQMLDQKGLNLAGKNDDTASSSDMDTTPSPVLFNQEKKSKPSKSNSPPLSSTQREPDPSEQLSPSVVDENYESKYLKSFDSNKFDFSNGPICIIFKNKKFVGSKLFDEYCDSRLKASYVGMIRDKFGNLCIYPQSAEDTHAIMTDTKFFGGCFKRNLAREKCAAVLKGISVDQLNMYHATIMEAVKIHGISSMERISEKVKTSSKILKIFFKNEDARDFLISRRKTIVIKLNMRNVRCEIEPCLRPINQCSKCGSYDHRDVNCDDYERCQKCSRQRHGDYNSCDRVASCHLCPSSKNNHHWNNKIVCGAYIKRKEELIAKEIAKSRSNLNSSFTEANRSFADVAAAQNSELVKNIQNEISQGKQRENELKINLESQANEIKKLVSENKEERSNFQNFLTNFSNEFNTKVHDIAIQHCSNVYSLISHENQEKFNRLETQIKNLNNVVFSANQQYLNDCIASDEKTYTELETVDLVKLKETYKPKFSLKPSLLQVNTNGQFNQ